MLKMLVRKFVPDPENTGSASVRAAYCSLAGGLGVAMNLLLFCVKLPIGLATGSLAIISDAFNNISDMGSSLITLVSARLANRRSDREHPFGHGRLEYVAALAAAMLILLVGFELGKESIGKLIDPEPVTFSLPLTVVMFLSIGVKLWMYRYNTVMGKKIASPMLLVAASDSLNDVFVTGMVVLTTVLGQFTAFPLDAVAGLAVAAFILKSGYGAAKETIDLLLGGKPDPALAKKLRAEILAGQNVVGVHDIIIHDYGPGRLMASAHAEVPLESDIVRAHEEIDEIEQRVQREMGLPLVLHLDPIDTHGEITRDAGENLKQSLSALCPEASFHDLRVTDGENRINVIFDLVVPHNLPDDVRRALPAQLNEVMRARNPRYRCVAQTEFDYTGRT